MITSQKILSYLTEAKIQPTPISDMIRFLTKAIPNFLRDEYGDKKIYWVCEVLEERNEVFIEIDSDYGEAIVSALTQEIKKRGWYVSQFQHSFSSGSFDIPPTSAINLGPNYGQEASVPNKLYHVALLRDAQQINSKGILPRSGNKMYYRYPDRIYLFCTYDLALEAGPNIHVGPNAPVRKHIPLVIFKVNTDELNKGTRFYEDKEFADGEAVWTYTHIPPRALKIVTAIIQTREVPYNVAIDAGFDRA